MIISRQQVRRIARQEAEEAKPLRTVIHDFQPAEHKFRKFTAIATTDIPAATDNGDNTWDPGKGECMRFAKSFVDDGAGGKKLRLTLNDDEPAEVVYNETTRAVSKDEPLFVMDDEDGDLWVLLENCS